MTTKGETISKWHPRVAAQSSDHIGFWSCATVPTSFANELQTEIEDLRKNQPINTNVRMFDLVRYMRSDLHEAGLINDEEYAWLCMDAPYATSPGGGSPSPRRLEDYDDVKAKIGKLEQACRDLYAGLKLASENHRHAVNESYTDYMHRKIVFDTFLDTHKEFAPKEPADGA